ncbi:MAG: pseudouridine synthase, partial [Gammaproteobacteria bacterium]
MPDKSAAVRHREVLADEAGQRIDNFLVRELKGVPKGHVYRLLRTGQVRVNRGRVKPHYRLQAGDSVRLPPVRTTPPTSAKPSRELTDRLEAAVIFEDRRLLAVNKPAGLAVHGGSGLSLGVIEALRQARPDAPYLELVHRLDRETSGCLLIAKRRSELRALHALLREGGMEKHYLALVAGRWEQGEREVSMHLRKNEVRSGERMVTVDESGKASTSRFRPVAFYADATLLEV